MSMTVSFRGGESTGGVADKQIETAKKQAESAQEEYRILSF